MKRTISFNISRNEGLMNEWAFKMEMYEKRREFVEVLRTAKEVVYEWIER